MIVVLLTALIGEAAALEWRATTWEEASVEGEIVLPPGMPLRIEEPGVVVLEEGKEVAQRAGSDGWWIDGATVTRTLNAPAKTRIQVVDARQWLADWAAWERDAARAMRTGGAVPLPPDGSEALAARVAARGAAVGTRTAVLGMLVDAAQHRGIAFIGRDGPPKSRTLTLAPGSAEEVAVTGVVRVKMRPLSEGFVDVQPRVNGQPWSLSGTGAYPTVRTWVRAPKSGPLTLVADATVPTEFTIETQHLRTWAAYPIANRRPDTPIDAAEWDALHGIDTSFETWMEDPDPALAEWARVRAVHAASPAELASLADPARPGGPAVAHAILSRADALSRDTVLAWWDTVSHPDPLALARWLDSQPATRSHGQALLDRVRAGRPGESRLARAQRQHRSATSRWVRMEADRDAGSWERSPVEEGQQAAWLGPGSEGRYTSMSPDPALSERVVLTAEPDTIATVGGIRLEGEGRYVVGLPAGEQAVQVERGGLFVSRDRWTGTKTLTGWRPVPLPARFNLPGRGAPMDLRVTLNAPAILAFDDGAVTALGPGLHEVRAGPYATAVDIQGEGAAALEGRVLRRAAPTPSVMAPAAAMRTLRETTARIDDGVWQARAERAPALAALGRRQLAWTDTAVLEDRDPVLFERAWRAVASTPVLSTRQGALDPPTARAVGDSERAEAFEALEQGDAATAARLLAGRSSTLAQRALRRIRWVPVTRADSGGGLVPIEREVRPPSADFAAQIDAALLAHPFPDDPVVVLRNGATDRLVQPGPFDLEVFCRDTRLFGEPCSVQVLGRPDISIADGATETLTFRDQAELRATTSASILVVRASANGTTLPPRLQRLGLAVDGRTQITLPADRLARVEILSGEVETTATQVAMLPGARIVDPRGHLELTGKGVALVSVSAPSAPAEEPLPRPERGAPVASLPVDAVYPTLERAVHHTLGRGPSWRLQLAAIHDRDGQFRQPWTLLEFEAALFARRRHSWSFADVWVRGPGGIGATVEGGLQAGRSLVALRGFAASTWGLDAGRVGIRLHARTEVGPRRGWMRVDLWPRAEWVSLQPERAVDPRVWSFDRLVHFAGVNARLSALSEPTRDLRLRAFVQANSNPAVSLDRVTLGTAGDWLFARHTRVQLRGAIDRVFVDKVRSTGRFTPRLGGTVDHDLWSGPRRWRLFASVDGTPLDLTGRLGVAVHGTRRRGLRDLPPTQDLFRAEREGR